MKMENWMFTMVKPEEMLTICGKENYAISWVYFLNCYVLGYADGFNFHMCMGL